MNRPPACTYLSVLLDQYYLYVLGVFVRSFRPLLGVFVRFSLEGVCQCKTTRNHRILWKTPTEALSGLRKRDRRYPGVRLHPSRDHALLGPSSSPDGHRIQACRVLSEERDFDQ